MRKRMPLVASRLLLLLVWRKYSPANLSLSDLMANAQDIADETVRVESTTVSGFEVTALAEGTIERSGAIYLTEPVLWLENGVPERKTTASQLVCHPYSFAECEYAAAFDQYSSESVYVRAPIWARAVFLPQPQSAPACWDSGT